MHPRLACLASRISFALFLLPLFAALLPAPARSQAVDTKLWVTDSKVLALVRDGNTLYVGGQFRNVGPWTGGGLRFTKSVSTPLAGSAPVRGTVQAAIPDGAGGWFIAGSFDSVGGQRHQNIARINSDGSVAAWNPRMDGAGFAIGRIANVLYVGGTFSQANGINRANLAAFDITTGGLMPWNPGASAIVQAIAVSGTTVYVGGGFATVGLLPRSCLAAVDTSGVVTTWDPSPNDPPPSLTGIMALHVNGNTLYVGGRFITIAGQTRNRAAAFDVTTGALTAWNPNVGSTGSDVSVITSSGNSVYLAGNFFNISGATPRDGIAQVNNTTGALMSWNPATGTGPTAMAMVRGVMFVGGGFATVAGQTRNYLAALDSATGAPLAWNPMASASPSVISANDTTLYIGGNFRSMNVLLRSRLASFDLTTGAATAWNPSPNNDVRALALFGNKLYLGGSFTQVGGVSRSRAAAVNATTGALLPWNPGPNTFVNALVADSARIYLGGQFVSLAAGTVTRNRIAAVDTATGVAIAGWDPNAGNIVNTMSLAAGRLYIAGTFLTVTGVTRNRLAAVEAATGALLPWNPNASGLINSVFAAGGGRVYVGGNFNNIGGGGKNYIAKLDSSAGLNVPGWVTNPTATVNSVMAIGNRVYLGGAFTQVTGISRSKFASVDTVTGAVTSWNPFLDLGSVDALATGPGMIYAGGDFSSVAGVARENLVALTDPALTVSVSDEVTARGPSVWLAAPAPQPMRTRGTIAFELPIASRVSLALHDIAGRRVRMVLDGEIRAAGRHVVGIDAAALEPGVYFARLKTDQGEASQRVVVLGQ